MPDIETQLDVTLEKAPLILTEFVPAEYEGGNLKTGDYLGAYPVESGEVTVDLTDLHSELVRVALGTVGDDKYMVSAVVSKTRLVVREQHGELSIKLVWAAEGMGIWA